MGEASMVGEETIPRRTGNEAPLVRVRGLSKRYGRRLVLHSVDLDIHSGEIYGLIGPDGAGKSSLMKAVAGVLTFDAGSLEVFGIDIHSEKSAERIKDRSGFMPQGLGQNLYPELSVEENIDFFGHSRLVPQKALAERKQRLLDVTRLAPFRDRPMKHLSGGMKQKLGLICTLIHNPRLIILDEPTTGVDPVSRRDLWAILSNLLRQADITAIVSTAYMDEASRFHRLSLLFDGQVVAQGTPEGISARLPGSVVSLPFWKRADTPAALRKRFMEVEVRGSRLRVFVKGAETGEAERLVRQTLDSIGEAAVPLTTEEPELEDIFINLLRDRKLLTEEPPPPELPCEAACLPFPNGAGEADTAIEANNLVRDFGTFRAVDGVSFKIAHGEIFGLLGANGAGKTTVIKMLVGLLKPTRGSTTVAGQGMVHASREIRERIGYMSQVFSLYGDLTVVENIRLYAGIYGLSQAETSGRTRWIIEMAGLSGHEDRETAGLPVGLRQRLALGCALVHRPRILFLDEPTSGVDPLGRRRFWDLLFRLSRHEGVALLITTHAMSEAEHCDRLALMYAGRIVADGSPDEMTKELEAEIGRILEVSTDRPLDALDFLQNAGLDGATLHGRRIHLPAADGRIMGNRVRAILAGTGIRLFGVTERPLTMEDVFVYRVSALEEGRRSAS